MTRLYGRAPSGHRVVDAIPRNHGANVTLLGVLGLEGVLAAMSVDGPTDSAVFEAFIEQVVVSTLVAGDVLVMDNLSVHKIQGIREQVEAVGASVLFLPPYSPDLSPIEPCWSKLKNDLRSAAARTREALDHALTNAVDAITPTDAKGWFKHCGYSVQ